MKIQSTRRVSIVAFLFCLSFAFSSIRAEETVRTVREFRGQTMGTTYMVKVAGHDSVSDDEIRFAVDAELRQVSDEMSTYLDSSEISRFNASESTDWFAVSPSFAEVVQQALEISQLTNGAFDVTVGPLVNAWNFGPERSKSIPDAAEVARIKASVGFKNLSVRLDPPALRKSIPDLQVDLSSIAKGHGVDRVIAVLEGLSVINAFVEIGGEVRTVGDKPGGAWKVGIQLPDVERDTILVAHAMLKNEKAGNAMATSGDYRNYYVLDGKRYSHTIDPRTGSPVEHELASATVIAPNCMLADAWATAMCVVGPESALDLAKANGLSVLLAERDGNRDFEVTGTGVLQAYAVRTENVDADQVGTWATLIPVLIVTFGIFCILLFAMAIGVIAGGRRISGSCGGIATKTNEDGSTSCGLCSNPSDACKDLRDKMQQKPVSGSA